MGEDETLAVASRIKQFIDSLGITITQFADNTGIQRSSMSQILGGRNQKISISTIGKIHARYPDLSVYWLLYGHGPMLAGSSEMQPEGELVGEPRLSTESSPFMSLFDNENGVNLSEDTSEPKYAKENEPNRLVKSADTVENERVEAFNPLDSEPRIREDKKRKIVKIMIFYSDNTFESFSPDSTT